MSTQLRQVRAAVKGRPTTGADASLWARIGYWAGLAVLQVLLVEFVVAASWRGLYSYRTDFVSELGVAFCGPTGNWPCSSLYPLMNVSIALFGVSLVVAATAWMVTGVVDVRGGTLLCVAGFGGIVAGVVNQGMNYNVHSFGATVFFVVGSLGLIVAGGSRSLRRTIGIIVTTLGGIGLTATLLYIGGHSVAIGIGAVERIVVYSIVAGTVILAVAHRATARRMKIVASADISDPLGNR